MDSTTLSLVYAAVLLACAGALLITWRQNPGELGPRSWAIGSVVGGMALFVFAATAGVPSLRWVNATGDLLAWLGIAYYARGTRQYVGLPHTPRFLVGALALAALAMFAGLALTPHAPGVTITASSFVFAVLCGDLVWSVMCRPETRRAPSYFLAFFFGIFGATHLARGLLTIVDVARPTYERPVDHAMLFVGILGAAATAMGFAMLTTERALHDRARHLRRLEDAVDDLRQQFEGLSAGDYTVRARRRSTSGPMDVLARLFNETAEEVGVAFDQLEKQRSVLAATLESMLDGLLLVDADGAILKANAALLRLLDADERHLVGRPLRELVGEGDRAFAAGLIEAVSTGPVRERPVRFLTATGALTLTVNASVHRDGTGRGRSRARCSWSGTTGTCGTPRPACR